MYRNIIGTAMVLTGMLHGITPEVGAAPDIVDGLQAQGYDVQLNGQPNGALAQCTVTGVHQTTSTAYVDLDCPGSD
jgi:hypothetical protein